jgi:hypothetical protein
MGMNQSVKYSIASTGRTAHLALIIIFPLIVSGCAMEFLNTKAAKELNPPPRQANLYAGWRVFQYKCASCHGMTAMGGERAPDLLPIIRVMNARQFSTSVLQRYDLGDGFPQGESNQSTLETRIDELLRSKDAPIVMPAWQGEPTVNAHILDLYAYLSARAEGKIGLERPPR